MSRREHAPPRVARALLALLASGRDQAAIVGDLDEEYDRFIRPTRGRFRAALWYWRQVTMSAPGLVVGRVLGSRGSGRGGSLAADVRFALRVLRRRPGFTIATVATLALALGVTTTVFSVVHAVLLQPLPFERADRLVRPIPDELFFLDAREAQLFGERMTTLESFAAWGRTLFLFTDSEGAEEVRGARVGWNHFDVLGTRPRLGRGFRPEDAAADDAIVLSHGLWMRRFGGDESVVGRSVDLFGQQVVVIGVMGADHVPLEYDWQAWRTLPLDPALIPRSGLAGTGRLRDGVSLDDHRTELRRVLPDIWSEDGTVVSEEDRAGLEVESLTTWLVGDARMALRVLMASVGFVLLLACANVANLFLAQGGSREKEFAVRSALGGSRRRVLRQRVVEVLLVCAAGAAVAVGASFGLLDALRTMLPDDLPRAAAVSISGEVVGFAVLSALVAALLTGALPILRSGRAPLQALSGSGRGASRGPDRRLARSWLVALEMALAVVLVIGAGLMMRTLNSLQSVDPGFDAASVVTVRPAPPSTRYPAGPELLAYYERLRSELASLPGVVSVGGIQFLPMTPGGWWSRYRPEGLVVGDADNEPLTAMRVVFGDYFETMGIPILEGRALEPADGSEGAEPVVMVNERFAHESFPGSSALGRLVRVDDTDVRIVGVAADVRQSDLRTTAHPEMYLPFERVPWQRMHLVARTTGDPAQALSLIGPVGTVVREIDPGVSMLGPRPMSDVVGRTIGGARLVTWLLALFGLVGLALGAVGVYGVTTQAVAERRREIGIRMALGADAWAVAGRTVVAGLIPVLVGVGVGITGALGGAGLLEGLLFGVEPLDPGTFAAAPVVLLGVAVLSLALPVTRATRVDPVQTLREE